MNEKQVTGRLENWCYVPQMNYLVGDIYDDTKKRFVDGMNIHTSQVIPRNNDLQYELKEGDIAETKHSSYLLGKPAFISSDEKEEELYYIQNGYVGNAVSWWRKKSAGYSTDIKQAGKYTKEEAERICQRPEDIAWSCDYIDNNAEALRLVVLADYIDREIAIKTNKIIIGRTK